MKVEDKRKLLKAIMGNDKKTVNGIIKKKYIRVFSMIPNDETTKQLLFEKQSDCDSEIIISNPDNLNTIIDFLNKD